MSELSATMPAASMTSAEFDSSADHLLMKRIASGDEAALTELVRLYGGNLATTISCMTGWGRDSEDILQVVLFTVWQKAHQYDGQGSLEGWLKRIAVNRCRNHFRLTNSIQRKLEAFAEWLGGRQNDNAEEKKPSKYQLDPANRVQSALSGLSNEDRTVLVLYYMEEMSGDEVASVLKIKTDTLHVRLHRARKRLKKILENE